MFPKAWKQRDIESLFEPTVFGTVKLHWINDTSAFVQFENALKAQAALLKYVEGQNRVIQDGKADEQMEEGEEAELKPPFVLQSYQEFVAGLTNNVSGQKNDDIKQREDVEANGRFRFALPCQLCMGFFRND
jgi:hypothetical protein